jgi:hypothetical protein
MAATMRVSGGTIITIIATAITAAKAVAVTATSRSA